MNLTTLMKSAVLRLTRRRSKLWPAAEREHLRREPKCQWCGGTTETQVHHVVPFHIDPGKELDPANMITMCMAPEERCHYLKGHNGTSWLDWNPNIREECKRKRAAGGSDRKEPSNVDEPGHRNDRG